MHYTRTLPDLSHEADLEISDIQLYVDSLDEMILTRDEKVSNIAMTAAFAGGKSSVIHTYAKTLGPTPSKANKYRHKTNEPKAQSIRPVFISLKSLSNKKAAPTKDDSPVKGLVQEYGHLPSCRSNDSQQVEAGILKQLLFRLDSEDAQHLPSRSIFEPMLKSYKELSIFILWLLSTFLILFTPTIPLSTLIDQLFLETKALSVHSTVWYSMIYLSLIGSSVHVFRTLINTASQYKMSKFVLGTIEADVNHISENKINLPSFDNHLEEIIYFFGKTKTNLVVFEDIDRFDQPDIFIKLSELNKIINDSEYIKSETKGAQQPIKFIYLIKDELFTSQDLTKLFDSIIPIVPVMSKSNSYSIFKQEFESLNLFNDFSRKFLRQISVYFNNPREVKQLVSEYYHYKKIVLDRGSNQLDREKLLAFMIYKFQFSEDFEKLPFNKGYIAQIFNSVAKEKQNRIDSINHEIKAVRAEIMTVKSLKPMSNKQALINIYKDAIYELENKHKVKILELNGVSTVDITLDSIEEMNKAPNAAPVTFPEEAGELPYDEVTAIDFLSESASFTTRIRLINLGVIDHLSPLNEKLDELTQELRSTKLANPEEILTKPNLKKNIYKVYDCIEVDSTEDGVTYVTPLIDYLLTNGYLNEQYDMYIGYQADGVMTLTQSRFVKSVLNNEPTNPDAIISNISSEEILSIFSLKHMESKSFINYRMIQELCEIKNPTDVQSSAIYCMVSGAISRNDYHELFKWIDIVTQSYVIIDNIFDFSPCFLFDLLSASFIDEKERLELLKVFLFGARKLSALDKSFISDFLKDRAYLIDLNSTDLNNLTEAFKELDLKFNLYSNMHLPLMRYLTVNKLIDASIDHFKLLNLLDEYSQMPFKFLFECDFNIHKNNQEFQQAYSELAEPFFSNEIKEILLEIDADMITIDDLDDYTDLFCHEKLSLDELAPIINTHEFTFESVNTDFPSDITRALFEKAKFHYNIDNLAKVLDYEDNIIEQYIIQMPSTDAESIGDIFSVLKNKEHIKNLLIHIALTHKIPYSVFLFLMRSSRVKFDEDWIDKELNVRECQFIIENGYFPLIVSNFNYVLHHFPDTIYSFNKVDSDELFTKQYLRKMSYQQLVNLAKLNPGTKKLNSIVMFGINEIEREDDISELLKYIPVEELEDFSDERSERYINCIMRSYLSEYEKLHVLIKVSEHYSIRTIQNFFSILGGRYSKLSTSYTLKFLPNTPIHVELINKLYDLGFVQHNVNESQAKKRKKLNFQWV